MRIRRPGKQRAQQFADAKEHEQQFAAQPLEGHPDIMKEAIVETLDFLRSHFVGLFGEINVVLFHGFPLIDALQQ